MKLKIKEQDLCFKISDKEFAMLLDGHAIHTNIDVLDKALVVMISPESGGTMMESKLIVDEQGVSLRLLVSPEKLQELSDISPSRTGLQQETGNMSISLQVDMPEVCHV